jgi:GT2 family glycosyltransferase
MPQITHLTNANPARLCAVVTLYHKAPDESETVASLIGPEHRKADRHSDVEILLFDNTPNSSDPGPLPNGVQYESAGRNAGLAEAYNRALDVAGIHGCSWLLLLDQDTTLPAGFLSSLRAQIERHGTDPEVVALIPVVRSGGEVVSPKRVVFSGLRTISEHVFGIQKSEVAAINSGVALRCDFVRSVGGFNRAYWLDYLDHWLFHQIYARGKKVALWNCTLEHHLSVQNYRQDITATRYRSIIAGESAFMTTHKPKLQIPFYLFRLLARATRLIFGRQRDLALITMATAVKIAMHPTRSLEKRLQ